ncbi:MAG: polysaccharide deacetylase family protein [Oscillospiraceae bacterium]|nr:polysaccharide deacetylase family protein [Oscillospiraceae bacterium]
MKKLLPLLIILFILGLTTTVIYVTYKPSRLILTYHSISETAPNEYYDLFVRPGDFEAQMAAILENNIQTLFFGEKDAGLFITFDDGYEDNYYNAFPIIKQYGVKVTIFMITSLIDTDGYLTSAQIREMSDSGLVSFGSHSHTHQNLTKIDESQLIEEFTTSKKTLERVTGKHVTVLSYPYGYYNNKVTKTASDFFDYAVNTAGPNILNSLSGNMALPRIIIPRNIEISKFINKCFP